ncbi:MAG TPA: recombination protein RecR [Candidatus Yonathbacteria bacterium]|nr:recombination protein RecR [Candidatus Yonathbacteria bacterium]
MSAIDNLSTYFMKFPGIGTRQAKRFVYFLLAQDPRFVEELAREIALLKKSIAQCTMCFRFYPHLGGGSICDVCTSDTDTATLLVVEKDTDFESVRRSSSYAGKYFILGGTIPVLERDPASKIRIRELLTRIEQGAAEGLSEVILALSANPEGDFTREYVAKTLEPVLGQLGITLTTLGRGLSTGTELEYSDGDTLRHALKNRS